MLNGNDVVKGNRLLDKYRKDMSKKNTALLQELVNYKDRIDLDYDSDILHMLSPGLAWCAATEQYPPTGRTANDPNDDDIFFEDGAAALAICVANDLKLYKADLVHDQKKVSYYFIANTQKEIMDYIILQLAKLLDSHQIHTGLAVTMLISPSELVRRAGKVLRRKQERNA